MVNAFNYVVPETIEEVTISLERNGPQARIFAGGTDLLTQIRENRRKVDLMIDIKQIPELNELSYYPLQGLTIGAAVSCLRLWNNPAIITHYPGLVDAFTLIGGIQIQGRATIVVIW